MKTKTLKNLIHPKLVMLSQSVTYTESGDIGDACDPHFSKSPCDCCGSHLAGHRYECEAVIKSDIHPLCFDFVNVCPNCLVTWE